MRDLFFVSCTRGIKEDTPLYRSLQKLQFRDYYFFERSTAGLPACYNEFINKLAGTDRILVFAHDDVTIADVFVQEKLHEAFRTFNVVGLVGSSHFDLQGEASQNAWPLWPREYLSGAIEHVMANGLTNWSRYGPTPRPCVVMDGLFLAIDMRTIGDVRFDTQFAFHLYDFDFCLVAHRADLALGTTNVYVQHASRGNLGGQGYRRALRDFQAKWTNVNNPRTCWDSEREVPNLQTNIAPMRHTRTGPAQADPIAPFQNAVRLTPNNPEAYYNLARALAKQDREKEAVLCYRQALRLQPDFADAHKHLGDVYRRRGTAVDEAVASYREAIRLKPDYAEAYHKLGCTLKDLGQMDEAIIALRRACQLRPDSTEFHSCLLYCLHFHPDYHPAILAHEHDLWYERHAELLAPLMQPHANDPDPNRRLRIGYVSPNFRHHPIGRFVMPLFAAHDRRKFEICCYTAIENPDDLTTRIRSHCDHWCDVAGVTEESLANLIRQDRIDILVDLDAHMFDNRLLTFARKPAPVQVTYLAYCSTTGLRAIDYRLTDPFLDPFGQPPFYAEESIWLPETYWCYQPLPEAPPVGPLPARAGGPVTFGCLNNFWKANLPTLTAWRDLLQEVPGSRLVLHAKPGSHRDRVRTFFAEGKIDPARVEFVGVRPPTQYFNCYRQIDIGLDPFHYGGGTTTCDALWMGVPVISLAGKSAMARAGLSILSNVGLPELVAQTPAEYVRIGADLAADLPRLAALRAELRDRMMGSRLMDAPRFARHVENAFRGMWQRWCSQTAIADAGLSLGVSKAVQGVPYPTNLLAERT